MGMIGRFVKMNYDIYVCEVHSDTFIHLVLKGTEYPLCILSCTRNTEMELEETEKLARILPCGKCSYEGVSQELWRYGERRFSRASHYGLRGQEELPSRTILEVWGKGKETSLQVKGRV